MAINEFPRRWIEGASVSFVDEDSFVVAIPGAIHYWARYPEEKFTLQKKTINTSLNFVPEGVGTSESYFWLSSGRYLAFLAPSGETISVRNSTNLPDDLGFSTGFAKTDSNSVAVISIDTERLLSFLKE